MPYPRARPAAPPRPDAAGHRCGQAPEGRAAGAHLLHVHQTGGWRCPRCSPHAPSHRPPVLPRSAPHPPMALCCGTHIGGGARPAPWECEALPAPQFAFVKDSPQGPPTANHQPPPTANCRQPPTTVQYCFCGFVSRPCLDHGAESVPVNVRFCWRYPFLFFSRKDSPAEGRWGAEAALVSRGTTVPPSQGNTTGGTGRGVCGRDSAPPPPPRLGPVPSRAVVTTCGPTGRGRGRRCKRSGGGFWLFAGGLGQATQTTVPDTHTSAYRRLHWRWACGGGFTLDLRWTEML